ncbi:MAG: hypothetical protein ACMG6S_25695, partial [Byssovorax sp.]
SSRRAVSVDGKARRGIQAGRAEAVGIEGEELLKGLRSQLKELSETIHLERSATKQRGDMLHAERVASSALCTQYQATFLSLEALCVELNAERADFTEIVLRSFGRARVDQIRARRARADHESAQGESLHAPREEATKPDGIPTAPRGQLAAHAQQDLASPEEPATFVGDEQPGRLRTPTVATTPEGIEEHCERLASTAADEADAEDTAMTRVFDKAATFAALGAGAGGATPNPLSVPRASYSGSVAPPASAPPPLPAEPGLKAAGLGTRPQGPHGARPSTSQQRTRTIAGMPALGSPGSTESTLSDRSAGPKTKRDGADRSAHMPTGSASRDPVSGFAKTLLSMPAQVGVPTSLPRASDASSFVEETDEERERNRDTAELIYPLLATNPSDVDGAATEVIDVDQQTLLRSLGQRAQEEPHRQARGAPEEARR